MRLTSHREVGGIEEKDSTLLGRRFEQQWTRFDGPYLWPKRDQLNGEASYRATVEFKKDAIVIEGERFVARRGAVVKTARDPNCDPLNMKRVAGGEELAPQALVADVPELPEAADMRRVAPASDAKSHLSQFDGSNPSQAGTVGGSVRGTARGL